MPERENISYYVINMLWFHRWQKYTGCFKYDEDDAEEAEAEEFKSSISLGKRKDPKKLILGQYPG